MTITVGESEQVDIQDVIVDGKGYEREEPFPTEEEYREMLEVSMISNRYSFERVLKAMRDGHGR